ncbi:hypothetical protein [Actinomadura miaoliensis]|uniref:Uncharacterized protein n=1 Tax=Actinomadura miaoliensis TaxID=430685 RepID=A0ABP7WFE1_9ACTN
MLGGALAVPPVLLTGPHADASDVRLTASATLVGARTLARERVHTYAFTVRAHGGRARNVWLSLSAPRPLSWGRHPSQCAAAGQRLRCVLGDVERSRRLRVDVRVPRASRLARLPALTALVTAGNADRPSRVRIAPPPVGLPADVPPVPKVPKMPKMPKAPDGPKTPPELDSPSRPDVTISTPRPDKPHKHVPKHKYKLKYKDRAKSGHKPKGKHRPKLKTGEAPNVAGAPEKPKRPSTKHKRPTPHATSTLKGGREPSAKVPPSGLVPVPQPTQGTAPSHAPSQAPSKAPDQAPSKAPDQAPSAGPSSAPSRAPSNAPDNAPSQAPEAAPGTVPPSSPGAGQPMPPMPSASPPFVAPPDGRLPLAGNGMTLISPTGLYGQTGTPWLVVLGMVVVAEVALLWLATCLALLRSRLTESMAVRAARRSQDVL